MFLSEQHIHWHDQTVKKQNREKLNGHKSFVLWFTGLSGSGKSTLANALEMKLHKCGLSTYLLDGDNIRRGLNADLSFSSSDRKENIRRVGEVAKLFVDAGCIVLTAFISPFEEERKKVRSMFHHNEFIEIYVKCPLEICEQRDPKGLYKLARIGKIKDFTGISSPYEPPQNPDIIVDTHQLTIEENVREIVSYLQQRNYILTHC
ncbi:adenylyl-sulfate kinase [Pueribacillus theae]|uniref:Adenylyl-sulfate kinase n=1 Tax=Pueribacillus theae TaxID=2171751 RepID=A0A2U1K5V1_9BACI|nr:adenylyl-sulfate kinase [Pueribacillus theae]PWA12762.1 adenylyl-sulfate kinase [Pueribacillus theae]